MRPKPKGLGYLFAAGRETADRALGYLFGAGRETADRASGYLFVAREAEGLGTRSLPGVERA
jgi:hypothetical protein